MLLIAACFGAVAALFTIIGVSAPGWNSSGNLALFKCRGNCSAYTAAGVLLIIAIVFLAMAIALTVMVARRIIAHPTAPLKSIILSLFILAAIVIVVAYSRALVYAQGYSYQLTAIASIFTFVSSLIVSYWIGRTHIML